MGQKNMPVLSLSRLAALKYHIIKLWPDSGSELKGKNKRDLYLTDLSEQHMRLLLRPRSRAEQLAEITVSHRDCNICSR